MKNIHLLLMACFSSRSFINKLVPLLAIIVTCFAPIALSGQSPQDTRTIYYYDGQSVTVPHKIERIATSWNAHNSILAMLGYGDKIVATTRLVKEMPLFQQFVPTISQAAIASHGNNGGINSELLIGLNAQILFVPAGTLLPNEEVLQQAGISVVALRSNSLDAMVERTLITGEILGPDALRRAQRFRDYYQDNVRRVNLALEDIPASERVSVYHTVGNPLSTSGRPSLNQDWMDLAGAVNVAEPWFENTKATTSTVSLEQILVADPDVIVAMKASDAEFIRQDPKWQSLRAVQQGKVYTNPLGLFWWCRETSEQALQFLWLAKVLYPQRMSHIDMEQETHAFYLEFYDIDLTPQQVATILYPDKHL